MRNMEYRQSSKWRVPAFKISIQNYSCIRTLNICIFPKVEYTGSVTDVGAECERGRQVFKFWTSLLHPLKV